MFSAALEPLNTSVSVPVPPSDRVAAVAGIPGEGVVAGAEVGEVVAAAADHRVVAVAADQGVVALAAGDGVVAGAAIDGQPDDARRKRGGIDGVVAAEAWMIRRSLAASALAMVTVSGVPVTVTVVPLAVTLMCSLPCRCR